MTPPASGAGVDASDSGRSQAIFPSDAFVLSAGCTIFRTNLETCKLQVCLIQNHKTNAWILPKGRKDQGEPMHLTAIRESYEETGFPCTLYPCEMPTRVPLPGQNLGPYAVRHAEDACEPFAVETRYLKDGSFKMIWWYLAWLENNNAEKVQGTAASAGEAMYESDFYDVEEALVIMEKSKSKVFDVLRQAVELVTASLTASKR